MLRRAMQRRDEQTDVVAGAAETGVSRAAVRRFLAGSIPRTKRSRNYAPGTCARSQSGAPPRARERSWPALVQSLPAAVREEAVSTVAALLAERHRAAGVRVPAWLEEIRER